MHSLEIVHTDLKRDNIMFDRGALTQDDITAFIEADPPRRHPVEESWECTVQSAVTQPLPLPSLSEASTRNYLISDFGSAQPSAFHTCNEVTAVALRAPEIIIRAPWNQRIDMWSFGCLIFELTTGSALFNVTPVEESQLDDSTISRLLWEMLTFTQDRMPRKMVVASALGRQYFHVPSKHKKPFCNLKASNRRNIDSSLKIILKEHCSLEEADLDATAKIMKRCLRINPEDRATAIELLEDPWWQGAA